MTASGTQSTLTRESLQGLFGAAQGGLERLPMLRQALEQTGQACAEEIRNVAATPLRLTLQGIDPGTVGEVLVPGRGDRAKTRARPTPPAHPGPCRPDTAVTDSEHSPASTGSNITLPITNA